MKFIADFHIHSKYSRATSKNMEIRNLSKTAKMKGVTVLGTGDFTHPNWLAHLKENLVEIEKGLYKCEDTYFILTSEVNNIFFKKGRMRKIHNVIFVPDFETAEKINKELANYGNLEADGRPTLNLEAKELLKIILNISEDCLLVPAHLWTPYFGLLGSKSGFDSLEECFENYTKYIYSIETGLSSDPLMNWRLSALDKITLMSNSDAHSPGKIGREANVFDTEMNYYSIMKAIKSKDRQKFLYTIEFFPQEGKYHYDGHRTCDICLSPQESKEHNNICPKCGKVLTIGVLNRVDALADRPENFKLAGTIPFKSLIPLEEIIAEVLKVGTGTQRVNKEYKNLIKKFANEFTILLDASRQELETATLPEIAEGIIRVREGKVQIKPGYDGVYGKIEIFKEGERGKSPQLSLFNNI